MADNYSEFSEAISDLTDEEIGWLKEILQPIGKIESLPAAVEVVALLNEDENSKDIWPRFNTVVDEEGRTLWLYSEDYFIDYHIIALIQPFLKRFRPNFLFTMSWADYCSKPRIGEFGGGAIIITAKTVKTTSTWEWIEKEKRALLKKKEK